MNKVLPFLLLFLLSLPLSAQTTFTGAIDNDWFEAGNWSNGLPTTGNNATIPQGVEVDRPASPNIDHELIVEGTLNITTAGSLRVFGILTVESTGIFQSTAAVSIDPAGGELTNRGRMEGIRISSTGGNFNNEGEFMANEIFVPFGSLQNSGNITINSFTPGSPFINNGTVDVQGNYFNGAFLTNNGFFKCAALFNSGRFTNTMTGRVEGDEFQNTGELDNTGNFVFTTVSNNQDIINDGNFEFSSFANDAAGVLQNLQPGFMKGVGINNSSTGRIENAGTIELREVTSGVGNFGFIQNDGLIDITSLINRGEIQNNQDFKIFGTAQNFNEIINDGNIEVNSHINREGILTNNASGLISGGSINNNSPARVKNFGTINMMAIGNQSVFQNDGLIELSSQLTNDDDLQNNGEIMVMGRTDNSGIFKNYNRFTQTALGQSFLNRGTFEVIGTAEFSIISGDAILNEGTIEVHGLLDLKDGGLFNLSNMRIGPQGEFNNNDILINNSPFINEGIVRHNSGTILSMNLSRIENRQCATYIYDAVLDIGGTFINDGTIYQLNTGTVNVTSGSGVVRTDLTQAGALSAVCVDTTLNVFNQNSITIIPDDIDGGSCNFASRSVSPMTLDCNVSGPQMVTLTVMDTSGNISTCTANVTLNCLACIPPDLSTTDMPAICPGESFDLRNINITDANNTRASLSYHTATPADSSNMLNCSGSYQYQRQFPVNVNGQLERPIDIALDVQGNIYVTSGARVNVFDNVGTFVRTVGNFAGATNVAVDAGGNIYATYIDNLVDVYDNMGNRQLQFGTPGSGPGEFNNPRGIAVDAAGNMYVVDRDNNRIQVFDNAGTFLRQFGSTGNGDGEFNIPLSIALDTARNIYVADFSNDRVQVFDNDGNFLRKFGSRGNGNGRFWGPTGITVDIDGQIYVADLVNSFVQIFDNSGTFLSQFGGLGMGDGEFDGAMGVAVDDAGNVYVVDDGNSRIQVFTPDNCEVSPDTTTTYYILADTGPGCTDELAVTVTVGEFEAPSDLCLSDGLQTGLGGGLPTGGVYSGLGVTDDGNGLTYRFDPLIAGAGIRSVNYTFIGANGSCSLSRGFEVFNAIDPQFSTVDFLCLDANTQGQTFGGGLPTGGVYSGPGFTDNGNGLDFSFDPAAAGSGAISIEYSVADTSGCVGTATHIINVFECNFEPSDPCGCLNNATAIDPDAGTGGMDGNFSELVSVSATAGGTLPPGQIWTVTAATGAFNAFNVPPDSTQVIEVPVATNGSVTLVYNAADGRYDISFIHIDNQGYSMTVEGPFALGDPLNSSFTISNTCAYPNPVFDPALADTYCPNNAVIELGGSDTDGIGADTILFFIDQQAVIPSNPIMLNPGVREIKMAYVGATGGMMPFFPGCIQDVVKTVRVEDVLPPRPVCQDMTVELDANGQAIIIPSMLDGGSNDNCTAAQDLIFTASQLSFTCADIGAVAVELMVSDEAGNTASCTANVMVEDNLAPLLTCPSDQTITLDPGDCELAFHFNITATDNCTAAVTINQLEGPTSGTFLEKNTTTTYRFEALDEQGNTSTCSFTITINEFPNPITVLACNDGVQISLDEDCEAEVGADLLLEGGPYGCYEDYVVELFYDAALSQPVPSSPIVGAAEIGLTLWTRVIDPETGNSCWGTIRVEDKFIPALSCTPLQVLCSDDLSPEALGFPLPTSADITANPDGSYTVNRFDACGEATLTFSDEEALFSCQNTNRILNRRWTIVDASGNRDTCTQLISLSRATLADATFPPDWDNNDEDALNCEDRCDPNDTRFCGPDSLYWNVLPDGHLFAGNPNPFDELWPCGAVKCQGTGIPEGVNCGDIQANFEDTRIDLCSIGSSGNCFKVLRKWTLLDWCTGEVIFHNQTIKVEDNRGPAINDIDNVTLSTDIHRCEVDWYATEPWLSDNCSTEGLSYSIESSAGTVSQENGRWKVSNIPVGTHQVIYIASDCCGNTNERSISLRVTDLVPPVPVCDQQTVVSISTTQNSGTNGLGRVRVDAINLDDGSYDNCSDISFRARRVEFGCGNSFFLPYVEFCCADIGQRIMVELEVRDQARNVSTCMITVEVQDKQPPILVAPPDLTITCDYWFPFDPDNPEADTRELDERFGEIVELNGRVTQDSIIVRDRVCEVHPRFAEFAPANIFDDPCYDDQYNIFWGFDGYGLDNCSYELEQTVIPNLNCGRGSILRRWRASDPSGNWSNIVSQTITVIDCKAWYVPTACWRFTPRDVGECDLINQGGLRYRSKLIEWPCDIELTTCQEDGGLEVFQPDNLEIQFDQDRRPRLDDDNCSLLSATYSDEVFTFVEGACLKIFRTWKFIDWCLYEDFINGTYSGEWNWEWSQVIKLLNDIGPEYDEGCEDLTFCGYGDPDNPLADQCVGIIELRPNISDDCTVEEDIRIDYKIDLDNDGQYDLLGYSNNYGSVYPFSNPNFLPVRSFDAEAAQADGTYPIGTHRILWVAEDGCGNSNGCEQLFTIEDCKPPTAYCEVGISTVPMPPTAGGFVDLWASDFDLGSLDNCTAPAQLRFAFSDDPNDRSRRLTCADAGQNLTFSVFVFDEAGNYASCQVGVILSDCDGTISTTASISGDILTEDGLEVGGVNIHLGGSLPMTLTTDVQGFFDFIGFHFYEDHTVRPEKDTLPRNGVTTFDLILMSKHILGIEYLNSPYKMIAADINRSGSITTFDMVALRKLILHIDETFPENTSWRFVSADFDFPDPADPFATPFPETHHVPAFTADTLVSFVAVKIGDINNSVDPLDLRQSTARRFPQTLHFAVQDQTLQAGETHQIDFLAKDFRDILGYQFSLNFDPTTLAYNSLQPGKLDGLAAHNFGLSLLDRGVITSSWNSSKTAHLDDDAIAFSLNFRAKRSVLLSEVLSVSSDYTAAEAYNKEGQRMHVALDFIDKEPVIGDFVLFQNQPNPFKEETVIRFHLPDASTATLTIYDVIGRVLKQLQGDYTKGYHELSLNRSELAGAGVLYYTLETETAQATRKMILLE
ncbi:MAG: HYR domain-containing protein [Bacteroidota bacterium]